MNVENIKYAIELMKSASNLNMCSFQNGDASTLEELHACGNTACFLGYLCLTDVWRDFFLNLYPTAKFTQMGDIFVSGKLVLGDSYALGQFLGIDEQVAHLFVFNRNTDMDGFYPVPFSWVKPEHVIQKLEQLLSGELV